MKKFKYILLGTIIFIFLGYEKNSPEIFGDTIHWKGNAYTISQGGHKEGEIGVINGKWAITTSIEEEISENRILYKANYVLIPENYINILKDYFKIGV